MGKQVPCVETGWHVFGQVVGSIVGIAVGGFVLFLLLIAPYERHKEVVSKLDKIEDYNRSGGTVLRHYYQQGNK